jgi:thiol-disulfide isomerase/thioredoxin
MTAASAALRSAVVALAVGTAIASPASADPKPERGPPPLISSSYQFVELRPLVEAPPLKLERVDGKFIDLLSFKGKVVLLSFWATWCPPCRRELPALDRLQRMLSGQSVEVIPVSVDRAGASVVVSFLDGIGVKRLRIFLDPQGRIGVRSAADGSPFVLYGMPITYVIDRQGRPVGYITGEIDWTSEELLPFCITMSRSNDLPGTMSANGARLSFSHSDWASWATNLKTTSYSNRQNSRLSRTRGEPLETRPQWMVLRLEIAP